jgi:hypothetical protein
MEGDGARWGSDRDDVAKQNNLQKKEGGGEREREVEATEWRDREVAVHRSSPWQSHSLPKMNNSLDPHADQLLTIQRFYLTKQHL